MDWILGQFVSGWELFKVVLDWSIKNPVAAMFWGGFWGSALNYLVKYTETDVDDSLLDAISKSLRSGIDKAMGAGARK